MTGPGAAAPFDLRVLTSDDWEAWRVIRLEALADAPYAFGSRHADWESAPEERWRARLDLEGSHNLVAYAGSTPVGMVTGLPGDGPGTVALISMYVAPEARGTGLVGMLLGAVEQWAVDRGAEVLCLDVREANLPARRSYERHGFTVTGEVARSSSEEPLELRMCRDLTRLRSR